MCCHKADLLAELRPIAGVHMYMLCWVASTLHQACNVGQVGI